MREKIIVGAVVMLGALVASTVWLVRKRDRPRDTNAPVTLDPTEVPDDVTLPECAPCVHLKPLDVDHVITLVIAKNQIRMPANHLVVSLPLAPGDVKEDFGHTIVKLGQSLAWAHEKHADVTMLALIADRATTFGLVDQVRVTAEVNAIDHFLVAVRTNGHASWMQTDPPRSRPLGPTNCTTYWFTAARGPREQRPPLLCPTIEVGTDGFNVSDLEGPMGPGCRAGVAGLTIPKNGDRYDYAALRRCLDAMRASSPEFANETEAELMVAPDVTLGVVIDVRNAIAQTDDGRVLFPEVQL